MTDKNLTHLYMLLDRSGSMSECREATIEGFNSFIANQQAQPGHCRVTLSQFDTEYETLYRGMPVSLVPPLELVPRNGTALLDGIGRTITEAGIELAAMPEHNRPGAVIVLILTDGMENSSREYTREQVRAMITHQSEHYQWLFVYVGANQDAITVARDMGIARGQTMTYNTANTIETFAALSANTTTYRGSTAAGASHAQATMDSAFTDEQREDAVGAGKTQTPATSHRKERTPR